LKKQKVERHYQQALNIAESAQCYGPVLGANCEELALTEFFNLYPTTFKL